MKSPMIQEADYITEADKENYSDLQVLQSNAGFYIGTLYNERGMLSPGTRDSEYFPTRESAAKALSAIEASLPGNDGLHRKPQSNIFK